MPEPVDQVVHGCGRRFTDKHGEQSDRRRDWGDGGTLCAACQEQKAATEMAAPRHAHCSAAPTEAMD
ncbi:hypothetical protein [Streptomyces goshikiensis]|uniref:hypothetical protein n=1 Tax=Streptomyces goshikiensis TaxID=1942 RepID=UPI003320477C